MFIRLILIAAVMSSTMVLAAAAEDKPAAVLARLESRFQPPEWLKETKVPFTDEELRETNRFGLTIWGRMHAFQGEPGKFREALATAHRVREMHAADAKVQTDAAATLAVWYECMLADHVRAWQLYRELERLSGVTAEIHDPQNHLGRSTLNVAILGQARNYVKLGLKARAEALLAKRTFTDWRELVDLAIIEKMLGRLDGSNARLEKAIAAGSQGRLFVQVSSLSRSIIQLDANGSKNLVKKYLPLYMADYAKLLEEQKGKDPAHNLVGQHRRLLQIQKEIEQPRALVLTGVADGTYKGTGDGLHGPITVEVVVKDAKIADVKVTASQEKRGFDSAAVVPAAIVGSQLPEVDGITGASMTARGIKEAVLNAIDTARKGEPAK